MEYLNMFQEWLYQTTLYQDFLKNMPPPVNNIYFDTFCIMLGVIYVVYRIVDAVRIARYHRKARERQAREHREKLEAEREIFERESEVREKEEKIGRFMDVMEMYFRSRGGRDAQGAGKQRGGFWGRIGRKNYFLSDGLGAPGMPGGRDGGYSEYDAQLHDEEERRAQEAAFAESRRRVSEQIDESMSRLEEQLRRGPQEIAAAVVDANGKLDVQYERRKARALKQVQREQRKAQRLAEKAAKRGAGHGVGRES